MELITTHPIKKSDLGFHGNLFGGKLLAWLDAAAVAYAMQLCETPRMVTVSIDKCVFEKPSKEGQLLKIFGKPTKIGNTSLELYIEAQAHNVRSGKLTKVLSTHMRFVYIDDDGQPLGIKKSAKEKIHEFLSLENNDKNLV